MSKIIVAEKKVNDYLTKSKIGQFAINPYVGCPHACKYCYASFMKRFTGHPELWGEFLDVKRCDKKIDLKKIEGKNVFMGTVTDCYNPYEAKYHITKNILEQLADSDCHLQISTRNKLILRDVDLLKQMRHLSVVVSINTLDEKFRRDMDKGSSIQERLNTLRTLHDNGIYTVLFISPIFIHITDWKAIIEASRDFVNEYWFENLNLRGGFKSTILQYVRDNYPAYYPSYERIYLKGVKGEIVEMENVIRGYCKVNNIVYSDYFRHEDVITDPNNNFLGKNREEQ